MKPRDNLFRSKMFQLREKRRQIVQLNVMMRDVDRMISELEEQIAIEEKKTGNNDVHHFAYSTLARAARQRRENLLNTLGDLENQKTQAEAMVQGMENEFERAKSLEGRERVSLAEDEIAFVQYRSLIG
ncbi:flagellar export protein FliJ [Bartonella sp. DGB2]|uniref:flagellar export protein FliJ n=1 Tax=Bartonella sp. DGB2 TaxID=3388426 RepID=UPI00398FC0F5